MAKQASGGHGVGVTRVRNVRVADDLWVAAQAKAADEGTSLSELIRGWLSDYVDDPELRGLDSLD